MIDGVKLRLIDPGGQGRRLRAHPSLQFVEGDHPGIYTATFGEFPDGHRAPVTFHGNRDAVWLIELSLHRLHTGGENWSDFDRRQFETAVDSFCSTFGLHDAGLKVEGLEFGANITPTPPFTSAICIDSVKAHRTELARRMGGGEARGIVIAHGHKGRNHRWKIYDKAHHFGIAGELLRIEKAHRQMAPILKRLDIPRGTVLTLSALRSEPTWSRLGGYLLEQFDELLITEPLLDTKGLRPAQRAIVELSEQPAKWVALTNSQRCRKAKALAAIHSARANPGIRPMMRELLEAKLGCLNSPTQELPVTNSPGVAADLPLTDRPGGANRLPITKSPLMIKGHFVTGMAEVVGKGQKEPSEARTTIPAIGNEATRGNSPQSVQDGEADMVVIENSATLPTIDAIPAGQKNGEGFIPGPPCATCGRPTGSNRKGSKFCSASFYGEREAKKCRNADSNLRHNRDRSIRSVNSGQVLFTQDPFIRPPQHRPHALR